MKFLKSLLLVLALCSGQFLFGQEPIYNWGPPSTNDFPERKIDQLLDLDNNGFVLLRKFQEVTTVNTYWLDYYNTNLEFEGTTPVDFNGGVMNNSYDIEDIVSNNGKIYAFISHWDKAAQSHSLALHELNLDGSMTHLVDLGIINAEKLGNKGMFQMSFSPDGSKLLVLFEMPFVKKTKEKLRLSCYDLASMDQIWSHDQELSFDSKRAANNDIAVGNDGAAYMFKKFWEKPNWKYHWYVYTPAIGWVGDPMFENEGSEIVDMTLNFDSDNNFFMFYTFSNKPSAYEKNLHGYEYLWISNNADTYHSTGPWPKDVVQYFMGDRIANDAGKSRIEDFYIKDIMNRKDGKVQVIMEQMKEDKSPIAGSSPIQYTYQWNYGSMFTFCLDPGNGEMLWWQSFNKTQEVKSNEDYDDFGSFVHHMKNDRLYVLWNNTALSVPSIPPANWTEPDGTKYVKHKAFNEKTMHGTFMHVIEPDGSLAYENRTFGLPLFNMHDGAVFEMSMTSPFSFDHNGDLVIMAIMHNGGKRYRFGFVGV